MMLKTQFSSTMDLTRFGNELFNCLHMLIINREVCRGDSTSKHGLALPEFSQAITLKGNESLFFFFFRSPQIHQLRTGSCMTCRAVKLKSQWSNRIWIMHLPTDWSILVFDCFHTRVKVCNLNDHSNWWRYFGPVWSPDHHLNCAIQITHQSQCKFAYTWSKILSFE